MEQTRKSYLTGPEVQRRYSVTKMTIHRWLADPRMGFPRPRKINNRNYFDEAELDAWDATRERRGAA
jgi:predicted DNA-binding transcriptional regulator AlpA